MADEALDAFAALLDSVPGWITELESILKESAERQKEILFENQPAAEPPIVRRKQSKTSSMKSGRPNSNVVIHEEDIPASPPEQLKEQLPHMTQSDALRLAQRKRKTASAASGSGPHKYRSKAMVVVYYDGETQARFERMVRAIGTSRNTLRKSRTTAKVTALARTVSSSSEGSSEEIVKNLRSLQYRSTRERYSPAVAAKDDPSSQSFEKADGLLGKAQDLIEKSAHQVLRDGDCSLEVRHAKEHFANLQKLGEAELPQLRKKAGEAAEQAAERQRRHDERRKIKAEQEEEKNKRNTHSSTDSKEKKKSNGNIPIPFSSPGTLEVDIEADEDEDDDPGGEFLMKTMQMSRYNMRSARLTG